MKACVMFVSWVVLLCVSTSASEPASPVSLTGAFDRLNAEQDRFHDCFTVFDDRDSGCENFYPSGLSGDFQTLTAEQADSIIKTNVTSECCVGTTCARLSYLPSLAQAKGWGGVSWDFPERMPQGPGYDLSPYRFKGEDVTLKFMARASETTEVTFAFRCLDVGGKEQASQDRLTMSPQWQHYTLDLTDLSMRNVVGGISMFTQAPKGGVSKVIYLDDAKIFFGKKGTGVRLNEPHFTRSYIPKKPGEPDKFFRNSCFSYDNAVMILAYCARGGKDDMRRARIIADAFIKVQEADRFKDGRVRNGYACGEILFAPPNREASNLTPRIPGFWCDKQKVWLEDGYCAGSDCGNMAWVGLALVEMCEKTGNRQRSPYCEPVRRICDWIYSHGNSKTAMGGYCGGVNLVKPSGTAPDGQEWIPWKSTEHNIDIYVLFKRFGQLSGEAIWVERADHARDFVMKMRDPAESSLWTGTLPDDSINGKVKPLDVNPWALMAFEDAEMFGPSVVAIAAKNGLSVTVDGKKADGYDFNDDHDGIWWEGTAQMVLAYRMLHQLERSEELMYSIRHFGGVASSSGAVVAATKDGLTTGFDRPDGSRWLYWGRPHVGGATCWYIFAELQWNPYWGKRLSL